MYEGYWASGKRAAASVEDYLSARIARVLEIARRPPDVEWTVRGSHLLELILGTGAVGRPLIIARCQR